MRRDGSAAPNVPGLFEYAVKSDRIEIRMVSCGIHDMFDNCGCAKKFNLTREAK